MLGLALLLGLAATANASTCEVTIEVEKKEENK